MIVYIFPGTFDPITFGHLSVIESIMKTLTKIDKLIIGVSISSSKNPLLTIDQRICLIDEILSDYKAQNIQVLPIIGNLGNFIYQHAGMEGICVRGIRMQKEMDYFENTYWPLNLSSDHIIKSFLYIIRALDDQTNSSTYLKQSIKNNDIETVLRMLPQKSISMVANHYQNLNFKECEAGKASYDIKHDDLKKLNGIIIGRNMEIIDNGHIKFINQAARQCEALYLITNNEKIKTYLDRNVTIIEGAMKLTGIKVNVYFHEIREIKERLDKNYFKKLKALSVLLNKLDIELRLIKNTEFQHISENVIKAMIQEYNEELSFWRNDSQCASFELLQKYLPNN